MIRSEDHVAAGASRRWPWWELSRSAGDKQCRRVTGDKLSKLPLKANFTYSSRLLFINGQYIVPSLSRNFIAELWFHLAIAKWKSPFVSLLVSLVVPRLDGHCVRLVFLLSFTFASSLPRSLATLHICLPAALPCSPLHLSPSSGLRVACNPLHCHCLPVSTFVSQLWACNPLHLSRSAGLLCPPLPCNP